MVLEKHYLSVYPIKYLNRPLLPNECSLDNTIVLISILLILIGLLILVKAFLLALQ